VYFIRNKHNTDTHEAYEKKGNAWNRIISINVKLRKTDNQEYYPVSET